MIERAIAVIGAGYGDEGKGMMTDWLVSNAISLGREPLVVRANGGGQAAHTVETPEGHRHVFKHVGSGAFQGAATYLAKEFIFNPIILWQELQELEKQDVWEPKIYVDRRCRVTLPMDMILNQSVEMKRGEDRHGSCGYGIGETVQRSLDSRFAVSSYDLDVLTVERLRWIRDNYIPKRMHELGLSTSDIVVQTSSYWDEIDRQFLEDCRKVMSMVEATDVSDSVLHQYDVMIFEGAQGLGLDQHTGHFPYVTRSCTGLAYPLQICDEMDVDSLEVIYVTRAYATRHGAGPLEREGDAEEAMKNCVVVDPTNQPNQWQGSLRVAPLHFSSLRDRILQDSTTYGKGYSSSVRKLEVSIAVTCLDQVSPGKIPVTLGEDVWGELPEKDLLESLKVAVNASHVYTARGPTRETTRQEMSFEPLPESSARLPVDA